MFKKRILYFLTQTALAIDFSPAIPVIPTAAAGTPVTEFGYNSFGQVAESIDPNGNVTQYAYDPVTGYLTDIYQDPAGLNARTHFTYDSFGSLDVVSDANNHATDYDYDALGWLNKVTNPLGFVTKHAYDANGNIIKTERQADALATAWQATQFTYDILNKLKTVTDPLNRVTTYNYDANENLASVVDAELNATTNVYDERDLLFTVTDANTPAGITTYDYDFNGNLAKITDASNNPTTYTYDLFNRLDITHYANLSESNFDYDKNSNLTRHTTPSGKPIEYDYDALNRLNAKRYPLNASLDTSYAYDLGDRRTQRSYLPTSLPLSSYSYDIANQLTGIANTLVNGTPVSQYAYPLYDNVGNRKQLDRGDTGTRTELRMVPEFSTSPCFNAQYLFRYFIEMMEKSKNRN